MRKSTIFISAVLTTFALVMLYGVVSAYRNAANVQPVAALTENTATPEPTLEPTATAAVAVISPEQAAQLAAAVVGNSNLLSAESSSLNGLPAYKITFTNNDVVYVGLDGQVLSVQVAPVVVNVAAAPVQHKNRDKNNTNSNTQTSNNGGESHEDREEHTD